MSKGCIKDKFWSDIVRGTLGRRFDVTIGGAECSATRNLGSNKIFSLGPKKGAENLGQVDHFQIIFKTSVPTSQETHSISITKTNRLILFLFGEIHCALHAWRAEGEGELCRWTQASCNTRESPLFSSESNLQMVRAAFCVGSWKEGGGSLPSMVIVSDNTTQLSGWACSERTRWECWLLLTWPGKCGGARCDRYVAILSLDHYLTERISTPLNF